MSATASGATASGSIRLELIAAVAANGVIGRNGQLPWYLPDDLKRFKQLTMGHPIIMGRKTFESIGKALPGRKNIVVSRTLAATPGVEFARSLGDAIKVSGIGTGFVIGGASLYEESLPLALALHLTELDDAVEGDVNFPPLDRSAWNLIDEQRHERDERHAHAFTFRTYQRKN